MILDLLSHAPAIDVLTGLFFNKSDKWYVQMEPIEYQFESIGPSLRIVVLVFLLIFALIALAVVVALAALPGKIAAARSHPQAQAVNICGWLGLPTGILWVLALAWAFWNSKSQSNGNQIDLEQLSALERQIEMLEKSITNLELPS